MAPHPRQENIRAGPPVSPGKDRFKRPYPLRRDAPTIPFRSSEPRFVELSNFHMDTLVTADESSFPSVEHGYQSRIMGLARENLKAYNFSRPYLSPGQVKAAASQTKRGEWSPEYALKMAHLRPYVMKPLLQAKFNIPHLAQVLDNTGEAQLLEASPNDLFWGCGASSKEVRQGKIPANFNNALGTLLEEVRSERRTGIPEGPSTLVVGDDNIAWLRQFSDASGRQGILTLPDATGEDIKRLAAYCVTPSVEKLIVQFGRGTSYRGNGPNKKAVKRSYKQVGERIGHLLGCLRAQSGPRVQVDFGPVGFAGVEERDLDYLKNLNGYLAEQSREGVFHPSKYTVEHLSGLNLEG